MVNLSEKLLKSIPENSFLKLTLSPQHNLSSKDRTTLIRKGNFYFNSGEYEKAERIFLTTGYTDGLIRMGDYHWENKEIFKAIRMYRIAPAPDKVEQWIEKASFTIKNWLKE